MKIRRALLLLGFLLNMGILFSQITPSYFQLTDEDGLPSNTIFSIYQSKSGYLWVGTDNGIARYDGKNFETFTADGLRGTSASNIIEDADGRIWFVNFGGQILYVEKDSLFILKDWENRWLKGHFPVIDIGIDNQLYISSAFNPLIIYDKKTNKFRELTHEKFKPPYNSNFLIRGPDDRIYYANPTKEKFYIYSTNGKDIRQETALDEAYIKLCQENKIVDVKLFYAQGKFGALSKTNLMVYWFSDGIFKEDQRISKITQQLHSQATFYFPMPNNCSWMMTYDGALFISENDEKKSFLFLEGFSIGNMITDRENNIWIASLSKGLFCIPDLNIKTLSKIEKNGLTVGAHFFTKDKRGIIYALMSNGTIQAIDPTNSQSLFEIKLPTNKEPEGFYYDAARDVLMISIGQTLQYHLPTKTWLNHSKIGIRSVKSFDRDNQGHLFSASTIGLEVYTIGMKESESPYFQHWAKKYNYTNEWLINIKSNHKSQSEQEIRSMFLPFINLKKGRCRFVKYIASQNAVLACFSNGLFMVNATGIKEIFDPIDNKTLAINKILYIGNDKYLLASVDKGILVFENGRITQRFDAKNGLPSNYIRSIRFHQGTVYAVTENKVFWFDIQSPKMSFFTKEDGLIANDILDLEIGSGELFIATSRGIQTIPYKANTLNSSPPQIYLKSFGVNEVLMPLKTGIELTHRQNTIVFGFRGIALKSRGNFSFRYRLLGLDTNWTIVSSAAQLARFHSLPSGSYEFQIKAINEDGISSKHLAVFPFKILKPFWLTTGFIIGMVFLSIFLIFLFYMNRIRKINEHNLDKLERSKVALERSQLALSKAQIETHVRDSQLAALKSQMNPHFIFNALNSIQEFILLDDKKTAHLFLGKFSELMRLFLDMSNKNSVSLKEELRALRLYLELESTRFEDTFKYRINIDHNLQEDAIFIPPMIIQPYVENAIKHGLLHRKIHRRLELNLFLSGLDILVCEVTDNGIGRKASAEINKANKKHTSFSTSATARRLELLNFGRQSIIGVQYIDMTDEKGEPSGTRVIIRIPIDTEKED